MPHVAWLGLGTILAMAGVASFIAGYAGTAIGLVAISVVFDVLYVLAARDQKKRSSVQRPDH